jgi:hypothetical protein
MGLLLFDAFEEPVVPDPEAVFVRAGTGRTVAHAFGGVQFRDFAPKDPADVDWVNFDFSGSLAQLDDEIDAVSVHLREGDSVLLLDELAHSAGVVSCRWRGGRRNVRYGVTCRVDTVDGRRWDLTGYVVVTDN